MCELNNNYLCDGIVTMRYIGRRDVHFGCSYEVHDAKSRRIKDMAWQNLFGSLSERNVVNDINNRWLDPHFIFTYQKNDTHAVTGVRSGIMDYVRSLPLHIQNATNTKLASFIL